MIDCRYYRTKLRKSLTDGSITSMKMRPKVSIDSIDRYYRYRSIDPSPIVPIYAVRQGWGWGRREARIPPAAPTPLPCHTLYFTSEPEFLNIYWRLKSQLFKASCLFKGHSVQQGSQWLQFFEFCFKDCFLETVWKNITLYKMTLHLHF
jgi:hypothetical protein